MIDIIGPPEDETAKEAYARGRAEGEIRERLAAHERHFQSINENLTSVARDMREMTLQVQRLGDQAEANARTVITTAKALKDADDARRSKAEQLWTPWQRIIAVIASVATIIATYLALQR